MSYKNNAQNLNARKFMIWLVMISSFTLIAGLTSVFIISTSSLKSPHGRLPFVFIISTVLILSSSITMHQASRKLKSLDQKKFRLFLTITMGLGALFTTLQIVAWVQLISAGIYFNVHKSYQSFIFVFVGIHLLHIIAGLGLLVYTLIGSFKNKAQSRIIFRTDVSAIFWHFIDLLWIYLYACLLMS